MNVQTIRQRVKWIAIATVPLLACSPGEQETAFANSATDRKTAAAQNSVPDAASQRAALRLTLAPTGNSARYRVRERLVGQDLPNDAIGETKNVTGSIAFDSAGKVIRQASKFTVDAGSFVSDKNRRDGFVRGRLLQAEQYPTVVLVPTEVRGVSLPLPTSGTRPIEILGDLTVRGVTRPTNWKGTAQFSDGRIAASAATAFTFDNVQMEQPRVPVLLSVADTIRLEIKFNLVPQP
ncbi:MAG TPA: YceI family protein [Gemmatimonadaceae bacterium]|jgi:polyisoprenoid-binding protein YceI|nr:YceI family protein [Gemmatimonadaceae bacterium]